MEGEGNKEDSNFYSESSTMPDWHKQVTVILLPVYIHSAYEEKRLCIWKIMRSGYLF